MTRTKAPFEADLNSVRAPQAGPSGRGLRTDRPLVGEANTSSTRSGGVFGFRILSPDKGRASRAHQSSPPSPCPKAGSPEAEFYSNESASPRSTRRPYEQTVNIKDSKSLSYVRSSARSTTARCPRTCATSTLPTSCRKHRSTPSSSTRRSRKRADPSPPPGVQLQGLRGRRDPGDQGFEYVKNLPLSSVIIDRRLRCRVAAEAERPR